MIANSESVFYGGESGNELFQSNAWQSKDGIDKQQGWNRRGPSNRERPLTCNPCPQFADC